MTDAALIQKKLAFIETCVEDIRRLSRPQELRSDRREQRFVLYTLQIAIQAALDVASHIVSDRRLGEPVRNRDLFTLLAEDVPFPEGLPGRLADMAGFRNVVVHLYDEVDLGVVERILDHDIQDLIRFVEVVRRLL